MRVDAKKYYIVAVDPKTYVINGYFGVWDTEDEAAEHVFGRYKVYSGEAVLRMQALDPLWKKLAEHYPDLYAPII